MGSMSRMMILFVMSALAVTSLGEGLWQAVRTGDVGKVRAVLEEDPTDLNTPGNGGQTPLMFSVLTGNLELVKALVEAGADTSLPEKDGYTPMHGAGFQGRPEIAKFLIQEANLDPSDRHQDGFTPLHRACWGTSQGHTDVVAVLLEAGVSPDEPAANGATPIEMAARRETVQLLKERLSQFDGSNKGQDHTEL